ncbi:MAG TPA: ATP-binding protein, partial [Vitreimonas sp.]|nr:ATP-binding protein [Vitreimonas sp.]
MDRHTGDARARTGDARDPGAGWPSDADLLAGAGSDRIRAELIKAQKMDAVSRLAPHVQHDLNNPLAAIASLSELIRRDPGLPAALRDDADLLVREADRTRQIVQNLFDFVRRRPAERHPTPLGPLVRRVLDLQASLVASHHIDVEVDLADDLPLVPLDRAAIQQVLLNLTANAIESIGSREGGGRLTIRAVMSGGPATTNVSLAVADDGAGVEEQHRERLFEPFFTTKPPGEGTGLGLAAALAIVREHGGDLRFEPNHGQGATFVVELPVSAA